MAIPVITRRRQKNSRGVVPGRGNRTGFIKINPKKLRPRYSYLGYRGHLQGGCFQSKSKTTLFDFVSIVLMFKDIYCKNERIYKINILSLMCVTFSNYKILLMLSFGSHICSFLRCSSISILSRTRSLTIRCIISLQDRCMPSLTKLPKPTRNEVDLRLFPRESTKLTCNEVHKKKLWLVVYLSLWKITEFVSWDDVSIPNINGKS